MMRTANVSWNRLGNALTGATFSIIAMSAGYTATLAAIGTAKFFPLPALITGIAGVTAFLTGLSTFSEAVQEAWYGLTNNNYATSHNFVRDTVFNGNRDLFNIVMAMSTGLSWLFNSNMRWLTQSHPPRNSSLSNNQNNGRVITLNNGQRIRITSPTTAVAYHGNIVNANVQHFTLVNGQWLPFLNAPATQNGTLVIGAGARPHPGAYNIDINPRVPGVHRGDGTSLGNVRTGSQTRIIIENPRYFDPLNPEIRRVLAPGGTIEITGTVIVDPANSNIILAITNPDVRDAIANAPGLGFRIDNVGNVPNPGFTYNDGGFFDPERIFRLFRLTR